MTITATHDGADQMGAPTTHNGMLKNCPAPECQDRVIEQQDAWGTYCPHGEKIVERDPHLTDPEGYDVGRIVTPWPCAVDGCTLEAFERREQEREEDYYAALNELAADVHR